MLSLESGKSRELSRLKREYDNLYNEALILKDNPESEEYQRNKHLRRLNLDRRLELVGGCL
jgi:hypothetical protein